MLLNLLPHALSELFAQTTMTGKLTLADRYGLMAALLDDTVSLEERRIIDRLLHALRRGQVEIVDEVSIVK